MISLLDCQNEVHKDVPLMESLETKKGTQVKGPLTPKPLHILLLFIVTKPNIKYDTNNLYLM